MKETNAELIRRRELAENVFELTFRCEAFETPRAGQFLNLTIGEEFTLKRPFGILSWNEAERTLVCAFRVAGKGTAVLETRQTGWKTRLTFPLGNGFVLDDTVKKIAIVGGGVGVFPLLSVFESYPKAECRTFLGFANGKNALYLDEFRKKSESVAVATDDGSLGRAGFVTALLAEQLEEWTPDVVLACGPKGMFAALKRTIGGRVRCLASVEERMGCGIGACLVCACKIHEHGEVHKKRVCKDGPVFDLETLEF